MQPSNVPSETRTPAAGTLAPIPSGAIGEKIEAVIKGLPPDAVTLSQIRDLIGQDGLLVLTAFLTIVFMVPVSIPGVSTVFGAGILLIGISRLFGRSLWLPRRIAARRLPSERLRAALGQGEKWVRRLERISRPHRMGWIVAEGLPERLTNGALIAGALLLMAPFGLIPFSNTLPALALLFLTIGLLQRDGLCVLFGHLVNLASAAYFAFLILGGGAALRGLLRRFGA